MLFLKQWEPILYHNGSTLEQQIKSLKEKEELDSEELKKLKMLEYGIKGEQKVLYELKNSHIGMYILHDINLKFNDLEIQIDFLIMTKKNVYVIECKNLYGNITINNKGDFLRETEQNGKKIKEGIYSPLTQCERHIGLLKQITYEKYGMLGKMIYGNKLDGLFTPIVVLANDKTILNDYYAPCKVKNKVVRADQLINYIKKIESSKTNLYTEKYIKNYCDALLKYQINSKYIEQVNMEETKIINKKSDSELRESLKKYRLEKSREEKCQAYIIFKDRTLEEIVEKKPKTLEELLNIEGFGQYKVEKYGSDILEIIKEQ